MHSIIVFGICLIIYKLTVLVWSQCTSGHRLFWKFKLIPKGDRLNLPWSPMLKTFVFRTDIYFFASAPRSGEGGLEDTFLCRPVFVCVSPPYFYILQWGCNFVPVRQGDRKVFFYFPMWMRGLICSLLLVLPFVLHLFTSDQFWLE